MSDAINYEELGTPELRDMCTAQGIEFPEAAKKPALIKLLKAKETPAREIDVLMKDIAARMGDGIVQKGSCVQRFTYIPIGCFLIDLAMAGGFAEGCGHMIYGEEGCGKSTWWILVAAALQRKYPKGIIIWVDVEKKFDPEWASKLGVDLDRIMVVKPRTGEHAVDIIEASARSIEVVGIFLDSIPALAPMKIIQNSADDPTVAVRARLVGLLCSKIQQAWIDEGLRGHKFSFFCVNQFREKIGVMHGDPRTLPGGRYQHYLVDSKLYLRKKEILVNEEGQERHTLNEHVFKFTKTKGIFSIKQGECVMVMDDTNRKDGMETGSFDDYVTVATYAKRRNIITGGGASWFIYGVNAGEGVRRKFGCLDDVTNFLKETPAQFLRLKQMLIIIQRRESALPDLPPDRFMLDWVTEEQGTALAADLDAIGYGYVEAKV